MRQLHNLRLTNQSLRLTLLLAVLGFGAFLLVALLSYMGVRQLTLALAAKGSLSGPSISEAQTTPVYNAEGTLIPSIGTPQSGIVEIAPSLNPWDGAGRVTVLLLGLDFRDWEAGSEASRSDTMILLTLDPQTKTAGILSVPRDLWVAIPGFNHGKINTAYYLGDAYKLPGGGPALAVKTLETFLGVPINYFAQIDFGAFVKFIDEIGGVKVDVPEPITIDLLGSGFKTKKKLQSGLQVLPGEWALAYARARYTEEGDFDRARRQQQVIMGIRDRILSFDMLPTLVSKAPTLYNELSSGIRTNLSLDELIKLAVAASTVSDESIQKGAIDKETVLFGTSPDGLSILIPLPDKIFTVRDQVFASSGSLSPATPGDAAQRMQAEKSSITVYNGSGVSGLVDRTAEYLRGLGCNISQSGEAGQGYTSTTIIDYTGNPFTLRFLVDLMNIHPTRIFIKYDPNSPVDVEVYLGQDWANKNSLP